MKPITDNQMSQLNYMLDELYDELDNGAECYIQMSKENKKSKKSFYTFSFGSEYVCYNKENFITVEENQLSAIKTLIKMGLHNYTVIVRHIGGCPDWADYDPNLYSYDIISDKVRERQENERVKQEKVNQIYNKIKGYVSEIHEMDYVFVGISVL